MPAVTDILLKTTSDLVFCLSSTHIIEQLTDSVPRFYYGCTEDFLGKDFEAAFAALGIAAPIKIIDTTKNSELTKEISNGYGKPQRIHWLISPLEEGTLLIGKIIPSHPMLYPHAPSELLYELRIRLSIINLAASGLQKHLPRLLEAYEIARQSDLPIPVIPKMQREVMAQVCDVIREEARWAGRVVKEKF